MKHVLKLAEQTKLVIRRGLLTQTLTDTLQFTLTVEEFIQPYKSATQLGLYFKTYNKI